MAFEDPVKDVRKCVKTLGFLQLLLVCDGLDEADLLDPCKYPGVMNHIVREMCYYQILNRLGFFFYSFFFTQSFSISAFLLLFLPDSVSNLGLNDPTIMKRWRRDVFPPRELQWETDVLIHLASRRFSAYQINPSALSSEVSDDSACPSFETLMSKLSNTGRVPFLF